MSTTPEMADMNQDAFAEGRRQDAAAARRVVQGPELLSHDELDRSQRQMAIGHEAMERRDLHRVRIARAWIATVLATLTIIGALDAGVTPGEAWGYVVDMAEQVPWR